MEVPPLPQHSRGESIRKLPTTYLVLTFLAGLLVAAYLNQAETETEAAKKVSEHSERSACRIEELEREVSRLSKLLEGSRQQHAEEAATLKKEAERQRQSDPAKNALRRRLETDLAECKSLLPRMMAKDVQAVKKFMNLEAALCGYLRQHLPAHEGFTSPDQAHQSTYIAPTANDDFGPYVFRCQGRINKIEEVIALVG
jgi:seryl-tRNA synthetase